MIGDYGSAGAQPYLDYFALPGNERYYDFIWGPLQLFAIDSDLLEPDQVGGDGRIGRPRSRFNL